MWGKWVLGWTRDYSCCASHTGVPSIGCFSHAVGCIAASPLKQYGCRPILHSVCWSKAQPGLMVAAGVLGQAAPCYAQLLCLLDRQPAQVAALLYQPLVLTGLGRQCRTQKQPRDEAGTLLPSSWGVVWRQAAAWGGTPHGRLSLWADLSPVHACRSQQYFRQEAAPMLGAAGMHTEVVETQHAGHATELARNLDLSQSSALVMVGGDGTVHEVLQVGRRSWVVSCGCACLAVKAWCLRKADVPSTCLQPAAPCAWSQTPPWTSADAQSSAPLR